MFYWGASLKASPGKGDAETQSRRRGFRSRLCHDGGIVRRQIHYKRFHPLAGSFKRWYAAIVLQIPQASAVSPPGIALFAVKKGQKPPAIPRCWTHGQRNVRVPLESSGRSVALRISSRLQGKTCEAILRVSLAMHNAPTRCALDFESATPRNCNASASHNASPANEAHGGAHSLPSPRSFRNVLSHLSHHLFHHLLHHLSRSDPPTSHLCATTPVYKGA
jgi:hypothetical protein